MSNIAQSVFFTTDNKGNFLVRESVVQPPCPKISRDRDWDHTSLLDIVADSNHHIPTTPLHSVEHCHLAGVKRNREPFSFVDPRSQYQTANDQMKRMNAGGSVGIPLPARRTLKAKYNDAVPDSSIQINVPARVSNPRDTEWVYAAEMMMMYHPQYAPDFKRFIESNDYSLSQLTAKMLGFYQLLEQRELVDYKLQDPMNLYIAYINPFEGSYQKPDGDRYYKNYHAMVAKLEQALMTHVFHRSNAYLCYLLLPPKPPGIVIPQYERVLSLLEKMIKTPRPDQEDHDNHNEAHDNVAAQHGRDVAADAAREAERQQAIRDAEEEEKREAYRDPDTGASIRGTHIPDEIDHIDNRTPAQSFQEELRERHRRMENEQHRHVDSEKNKASMEEKRDLMFGTPSENSVSDSFDSELSESIQKRYRYGSNEEMEQAIRNNRLQHPPVVEEPKDLMGNIRQEFNDKLAQFKGWAWGNPQQVDQELADIVDDALVGDRPKFT